MKLKMEFWRCKSPVDATHGGPPKPSEMMALQFEFNQITIGQEIAEQS
jgi:hypothetical protein